MGVTAVRLLGGLGLLVIIVQAQDCPKPVGGPNMDLKGNDILLTEFPDGKKVTFTCNIGYVSKGGSPSITCSAGSWSALQLQCERFNCGSADDVEYGHVEYQPGTEFGDKAVAICNTGYLPVGKGTLTCGAQGWEGKLPVCEVVKCDPPQEIVDGSFSPNKVTYDYNDVVRYTCKKGYTRSGASEVTCSDDGTFKPGPPKCIKVNCAEPKILNGIRTSSGPPYGYLFTVTFECSTGYRMNGSATQTCNINNQWEPGLPACTAEPKPTSTPTTITTITTTTTTTTTPPIPKIPTDDCEDPHKLNPQVTVSRFPPYRRSDQVTVSCNFGDNEGHKFIITCKENGLWYPEIPKCEREGNGSDGRTSKLVTILVVIVVVGGAGGVVASVLVYIKKRKGTRRGNTDKEATKEGEDVALS